MKQRKPGTVKDGRIPIYADGVVVGDVGPSATQATVRRFNTHDATLRKMDGRLAWVGFSKPLRRRPESASHKAARGSVKARGANGAALHEIGRAIVGEALAVSGPDTRMAFAGRLPSATNENS